MQTNNHYNNNKRAQQEDPLIQQLLSKYLPYWPYFLLSLVIGIGLAFVYLKYTKPVYEAKAAILIKDEKKGSEESKMASALNQMSSNVIVENEVEILQTYTLMSNTAKALYLYAPVFQKEKFQTFSAYTKSPIIIEVANPDSIKEFNNQDSIKKYQKIYFSYEGNTKTVLLGDGYKYAIDQWVNTPYGKLKFIPNKYYETPEKTVESYYFSLVNPKSIVPGLLSNLTVEPSGKLTSFINLSYKDEVPQRAEDMLNQLITSYQESEISEKDTLAKNTLIFVTQRLNLVANELDSIERKIQQYKSGRGAVDIGRQGQLYLENVSVNDQKLSEVTTQLSVLNQVEKFVKSNENSDRIIPSALGISDPVLSQLIDKLYLSELQYEKLKTTVGENNSGLLSVKDQSNLLKNSILQNIQSQKQSLNATRSNISATSGAYNSLLQVVPQKERQLLDISREQQIKGNIYAFLLQKKEESELAYASTISNSRLVDMAHIIPVPVSPKKPLILLVAVFGCLGICLAIIFIRDLFLDKVQYRSEIQSLTDIPVLTEIDFDKSKSPLIIKNGEKSFTAEQFRKLRISLSFLDIGTTQKRILVTSGIAGEGKSFVAANLALSLAASGKSVVLVDMDLHKPALSKTFQFEKEEGVSEFLMGLREAEAIIHNIEEYENLSFVAAGNSPENPSELWSTKNAERLTDYLSSIYDFVVIDTSPILLVNDGYILTELCDATLYVVRQNYTPKMILKKMEEDIQINPIKNLGIVFNGVKTRGFFRDYNKYGYDYGYSNNKRVKFKKPVHS